MTALLLPFSWLYGLAIRVRNFCYDVGIVPIVKLGVPVISVGNLSTGGTGKTPIVEYIMKYFINHNKRVAVISRGYKRSTTGTFVVSDGVRRFGTVTQTGDEAFQIANNLPTAFVVTDEQRVRGARIAIDRGKAEVVILDDGFQHRRIGRNVDIVVVDGTTSLRKMHLLPAGMRRESLTSLKRATMIAVSRSSIDRELRATLSSYTTAPVVEVRFIPTHFQNVLFDQAVSISSIKGKCCVAFCGIGNPSSFRQTLESTGLHVLEMMTFPDHYGYTMIDMQTIIRTAHQTDADFIITTEKDAVRLNPELVEGVTSNQNLLYVKIEAVITEGEAILHNLLQSTMKRVA